jgi:hypothetical protein
VFFLKEKKKKKKVEAVCDDDNVFYVAKVEKVHADGCYDVRFLDFGAVQRRTKEVRSLTPLVVLEQLGFTLHEHSTHVVVLSAEQILRFAHTVPVNSELVFSGAKAVDTLLDLFADSRVEAVSMASELMGRDFFEPVVANAAFSDSGSVFFRFLRDHPELTNVSFRISADELGAFDDALSDEEDNADVSSLEVFENAKNTIRSFKPDVLLREQKNLLKLQEAFSKPLSVPLIQKSPRRGSIVEMDFKPPTAAAASTSSASSSAPPSTVSAVVKLMRNGKTDVLYCVVDDAHIVFRETKLSPVVLDLLIERDLTHLPEVVDAEQQKQVSIFQGVLGLKKKKN